MLVPKAATVEAPTYPPVASQTILDPPHFAMVPILRAGDADLIAVGREALYEPYWAHRAAERLKVDPDFTDWPLRHGAWLAKRDRHMGSVIEERRRALITDGEGW